MAGRRAMNPELDRAIQRKANAVWRAKRKQGATV